MLSFPGRVTLIAGLGSLVLIIVAGAAFREEIMTQYHLLLLRKDSVYLHGILTKPEGTPQRAAVRKYLESKDGKVALFRECLEPSYIQDYVKHGSRYVSVCVSVGTAPVDSVEYDQGGWPSAWHPGKPEWLRLTHEYLKTGTTFTFSEYPGMTFEFLEIPDIDNVNR